MISTSRKIRFPYHQQATPTFNKGFHQQKQKLRNAFLSKKYSFIQIFLLLETIIETWRPIFLKKLRCS